MTDLSGDSGAIGRLMVGGSKEDPQLQIDLKGGCACGGADRGWALRVGSVPGVGGWVGGGGGWMCSPGPPTRLKSFLWLLRSLPLCMLTQSRPLSPRCSVPCLGTGVLYNASIVPCPVSMAVVHIGGGGGGPGGGGGGEAKVECLFSEFVQLRCGALGRGVCMHAHVSWGGDKGEL